MPKITAYAPITQTTASAPAAGFEKRNVREHQRQNAAQNQQPFAFNFLPKTYRTHDFQDAGQNRPDRNDREQRNRGDPGPDERDDPCAYADKPLQQRDPPMLRVLLIEAHDEQNYSFRQRVNPEGQDQSAEGDCGQEESQEPERYRERAPQFKAPPVSSEKLDHSITSCTGSIPVPALQFKASSRSCMRQEDNFGPTL